jgi:nitrite reductase/ring-hydroxylating ferredoxin subunit
VRIETQRELLRRFFELRAAHTTTMAPAVYRQRADVYTDPERLRLEEVALFRVRPLVCALSADVPTTGDCCATKVAGVPLLLARGEDAEVRAFLNICWDRGGRVFSGRGRPGRALKCPYHSWAYDLHGDLLGQPLARSAFDGLERTGLGLVPVPVAERFGLVFVRVGGAGAEPIDVEAELAGLGPEIADWGFERWHYFDERGGVFDANWKLIRDTFLESYHIFSLHRDTLAPDMLSTPFVGEDFGPHSRGVVMRKEVVGLLERPESEWGAQAVRLGGLCPVPGGGDQPADERARGTVDDVPRARRCAPHARERAVLRAAGRCVRSGTRLLGGECALHDRGRVRGGLWPAAGHPPLAPRRADAGGRVRAQRARADPPSRGGGEGAARRVSFAMRRKLCVSTRRRSPRESPGRESP